MKLRQIDVVLDKQPDDCHQQPVVHGFHEWNCSLVIWHLAHCSPVNRKDSAGFRVVLQGVDKPAARDPDFGVGSIHEPLHRVGGNRLGLLEVRMRREFEGLHATLIFTV